MRWDVPEAVRCDLLVFSGINFSGSQKMVRFYGKGGKNGPELEAKDIQSLAVIAPVGTRVVFMTTISEADWSERPWRAVEVLAGKHYKTKDGHIAVRIPDLDALDAHNAPRTDPDFSSSPNISAGLEDRKDWTYGRPGKLKGNVHAIRIDLVDQE